MRLRSTLLVASVAVAAASTLAFASGDERRASVSCAVGGPGTMEVSRTREIALGPLVLLGARLTVRHAPDAFNGHGYKVPVTLSEGKVATLSVPRASRGHVGLVFTHRAQDRAWRAGVKGADRVVRFAACSEDSAPERTGWPGGLVVDRRRCATLVVTVRGGESVRRRVPLGRRCQRKRS